MPWQKPSFKCSSKYDFFLSFQLCVLMCTVIIGDIFIARNQWSHFNCVNNDWLLSDSNSAYIYTVAEILNIFDEFRQSELWKKNTRWFILNNWKCLSAPSRYTDSTFRFFLTYIIEHAANSCQEGKSCNAEPTLHVQNNTGVLNSKCSYTA